MNKEIFMNLLQAREYKAVRSILNVMNAVDIAALMEELEDKDLALAFRLIPKDKAAEVFANMNSPMQSYLVEIFTEKELKEMLDEMFLDDTVDLLEDLPANLVTRILESVSAEKRRQINILLNYPEDSAGSVMTTEYVDLRKTTTVAEAREQALFVHTAGSMSMDLWKGLVKRYGVLYPMQTFSKQREGQKQKSAVKY